MTATLRPVSVLRPDLRRPVFVDDLAPWLAAGIREHRDLAVATGPSEAVVVIVPEYRHAAPPSVLADLAAGPWGGRTVAVVGYGGRTRARRAIADARCALEVGGAAVLDRSVGLDVAAVRGRGFDRADRLFRDLVLDQIAAAGSPARA